MTPKTAKKAVFREISADFLTPVGIVEALETEMHDGVILESGRIDAETGRYSYIAFNRIAQLRVESNTVTTKSGTTLTTQAGSPFTALRQLITDQAAMNDCVGFINYGDISNNNIMPDMAFNFYETALIFDHLHHTLKITVISEDADEKIAQSKIDKLIIKITMPISRKKVFHPKTDSAVEMDMPDKDFMRLVEKAKRYIKAGDAFQIVLSRCFKKRYSATAFEIYRALRRVSPAPYMFYLPFENGVMVGASPEKLISVRNKKIQINPIAGTRPRHNETDDERIKTELLHDPKECAEHIMLVDLARNDLGVVCKPGTITVDEFLKVKHFTHVSHMCSSVSGELENNKDALDALSAAFPAGTLSGAPKIRAMEIIDECETSQRGIYGGAICRLDSQLNLDSCIAIRMAVLQDGIATVQTGAGIVYDSDPQSESNETHHKAKGVLAALTLAEEENS